MCILGSLSFLNMTLIYNLCQVGDILHSSLCLYGFRKSIFLFSDYQFRQHDLWSYLSQLLPPSGVVSPICSREILFVKHLLHIWPPLLQYIIIPIILRYPMFHVDDSRIIWPSFNKSLIFDLSSLSRKMIYKLLFSTLELACLNGKFFMFDDKFISLDLDQIILQVFNFK